MRRSDAQRWAAQKVLMSEELEQLSTPTESAASEAPAPSNTPNESHDDTGTEETGLLGQVESDDDEIEVTGKKYRVPKELSAHLKELEQGNLRQDDYTRKTQTAAEKVREVEARAQALQARENFNQQHIQAVAEIIGIDKQLAAFQKLDWNAITDAEPVQAMKLERQMRELQQQKTQLVHGIEQTRLQQDHSAQQAAARRKQESVAQLQKEIKGFGTPEVARELYEAGTRHGIKPDEWDRLDDPRIYKLIHIANQYDKLIAKQKTEAKPKPAEVVPINRVSPGAGAVKKSITDPKLSVADFIKQRNDQLRRK